jgi:hypothetical protein
VHQDPLFTSAPTAMTVSLHWGYPSGWRLAIHVRRSGQQWSEGESRTFEGLALDEALDALEASARSLLDPAGR